MTLVNRPTPPVVDRPELAVPKTVGSSCGCEFEDPDLVRLRDLMAGGMSQHDASQEIWGAPPPPALVDLPPAITPRPSRHARLLNRWINREVS